MNNKIKIEDLGYNVFFESNRNKLKLDNLSVARVIVEHKGAQGQKCKWRIFGENNRKTNI